MQYDNTNRGSLSKNDRKEKDTQPDYRGSINVEGREYWVSSWIKKSQKGDTFMSLSVEAKKKQGYTPQVKQEPQIVYEQQDEIPF